jgi:hypothetical protein
MAKKFIKKWFHNFLFSDLSKSLSPLVLSHLLRCLPEGPSKRWKNRLSTMRVSSGFSTWGQFHQCSTSSFYASRSQKWKKTVKLSVFFSLLGSASAKAACRTLMKLTPGAHFTNMFTCSFYMCRSQKHKKTVKSSVYFCSFRIFARKSCS